MFPIGWQSYPMGGKVAPVYGTPCQFCQFVGLSNGVRGLSIPCHLNSVVLDKVTQKMQLNNIDLMSYKLIEHLP